MLKRLKQLFDFHIFFKLRGKDAAYFHSVPALSGPLGAAQVATQAAAALFQRFLLAEPCNDFFLRARAAAGGQ